MYFVYQHVSSSAIFVNKTNFIFTIIKYCIPQARYNYSLSSDFFMSISHAIKLIHNIMGFYVMPNLTKWTKNSCGTIPYPDAFNLINYRVQKLFSFIILMCVIPVVFFIQWEGVTCRIYTVKHN